MKAGLFYLDFLRSVVTGVEGGSDDKEKENIPSVEELDKGLDEKMHDLKKALEKALLPKLDRATLEKRLKEFYKEKKDKDSLKNLKSIVDEYIDKQHLLFEELHKSYPGSDFSWFTNNPDLYKLSKGTSDIKKDSRNPLDDFLPSGFSSTLNSQQEAALQELWEIAKDSEHYEFLTDPETNPEGDAYLLRFLRATMEDKRPKGKRVFKPEAAAERLFRTAEWKKAFVPQYEPENFQEFRKIKPTFVWKDYAVKAIVLIERSGKFWTKADPEIFKEDEWEANFAYAIELMEEKRRELQHEFGVKDDKGIVIIQDVKGIGLSARKCLDLFKLYNSIAGENYPELIRKVYVVNAPWIFAKVFAVIKLFIDPDTIAKVEVYKGIPRKQFSGIFDLDKLPKEYGGENAEVVEVTTFNK